MADFAPLTWDDTSKHNLEMGVKKGVLYPYDTKSKQYTPGVAWNGLTAVTESPSGAEATPLYADDKKFRNLISIEEFGATVECYTYPDEFAACNGEAELIAGVYAGQQSRSLFGMSYVTTVSDGNNVETEKIHLIYGATAAPSERAYTTINDSPEAITFSYEIKTTPVPAGEDKKPTACVTIDVKKITNEAGLKALKDALYGTNEAAPYLPLPAEVVTLLNKASGT
jgi:hypothetical protein